MGGYSSQGTSWTQCPPTPDNATIGSFGSPWTLCPPTVLDPKTMSKDVVYPFRRPNDRGEAPPAAEGGLEAGVS